MLKKLARFLLGKLIKFFDRYKKSKSSEERWVKEHSLDSNLISSNDEPPAHWLRKVREGAPHLLDATSHQSYFASGHSEINNSNIQRIAKSRKGLAAEDLSDLNIILNSPKDKPPADWSTKIRYKASHQLNFDNARKHHTNNSPETNKRVARSTSNIYLINDRWTPLSENFMTRFPAAKQRLLGSNNESQCLANKDQKKNVNRPGMFHSHDTRKVSLLSEMLAFNKSKQNQLNQKESLFHSVDYVHDNYNFKAQGKSCIHQEPIITESENTKRMQPSAEILAKHSTLGNRTKIHLYPQVTQLKPNKCIDSKTSLHHSISTDEKISSNNRIKVPRSEKGNVISFNFADNPDNYAPKKKAAANDSALKTSKSVRSNVVPENIAEKNSAYVSYKFNQSHLDKSHWPNLPDEIQTAINQDRWPPLTEAEVDDRAIAAKLDQLNSDYLRLQEIAKRMSLSDLEQRGRLWNE